MSSTKCPSCGRINENVMDDHLDAISEDPSSRRVLKCAHCEYQFSSAAAAASVSDEEDDAGGAGGNKEGIEEEELVEEEKKENVVVSISNASSAFVSPGGVGVGGFNMEQGIFYLTDRQGTVNAVATDKLPAFDEDVPKGHIYEWTSIMSRSMKLEGAFSRSLGNCPLIRIIDISNTKISGELPKEIRKCGLLEVLNMTDNQLSGRIPAEIGKLKNLVVLNLSGNKLRGSIPISLLQCKELRVINLSRNHISGAIPDGLGGKDMLKLEEVHLAGNKLFGVVPESLYDAKSLKMVDLSSNKLEIYNSDKISAGIDFQIGGNPYLKDVTYGLPYRPLAIASVAEKGVSMLSSLLLVLDFAFNIVIVCLYGLRGDKNAIGCSIALILLPFFTACVDHIFRSMSKQERSGYGYIIIELLKGFALLIPNALLFPYHVFKELSVSLTRGREESSLVRMKIMHLVFRQFPFLFLQLFEFFKIVAATSSASSLSIQSVVLLFGLCLSTISASLLKADIFAFRGIARFSFFKASEMFFKQASDTISRSLIFVLMCYLTGNLWFILLLIDLCFRTIIMRGFEHSSLSSSLVGLTTSIFTEYLVRMIAFPTILTWLFSLVEGVLLILYSLRAYRSPQTMLDTTLYFASITCAVTFGFRCLTDILEFFLGRMYKPSKGLKTPGGSANVTRDRVTSQDGTVTAQSETPVGLDRNNPLTHSERNIYLTAQRTRKTESKPRAIPNDSSVVQT